jgi:hypothetical protein
VAAVGIIIFVFAWSDYLFAVVLSVPGAAPVAVGAAFYVTSAGVQRGNLAAVTVISVIIPLCFAFIAQRHLVRELSAGAIKRVYHTTRRGDRRSGNAELSRGRNPRLLSPNRGARSPPVRCH